MYQTTAPCEGGPLDGGIAAVPNPDGPVLRGATLVVTLDDTRHEYLLVPIGQHPFQVFKYQGVTVDAPTDIVDR